MSYNDKEIAFINDLRELMKKHDVELNSYDQYGENGYTGTDWEFSSKSFDLCVELDGQLLREL